MDTSVASIKSTYTNRFRGRWLWMVLAVVIAYPIANRVYRILNPTSVRAVYENGLHGLSISDLGAVQLAAEALSVGGVEPYYKDVLEGAIDLRLGRAGKAAATLRPALQFADTAALAHALTGEALYKSGQFAAAIEILKRAIELDENFVDAHRWLAASYYDIGATGPTVKELAKVSQLAPSDPRPHRLTGLIYKDMESYDAAITQYREALKRSSDFPDRNTVLRELAECLWKTGQHAELDRVLEQCPLDPLTLTLSAESQYARGNSAQATRLVDQALAMDSTNLAALLLKATIQSENSELNAAIETLRRTVAAYPLDNKAHYQLSQLYARTGDTASAEKHSTEAARLRDLRAHFTDLHAQASENLNNAEVRYQLGITAKDLGLRDLAQSWLSAALALDPSHAAAATELQALIKPAPQANSTEPKATDESVDAPEAPADNKRT